MDRFIQYIEDPSFIEWVFQPTSELQKKWNDYMHNHPDEISAIGELKDLLLNIQTEDQQLSQTDQTILLMQLAGDIALANRKKELKKFYLKLTQYAAVAAILIAAAIWTLVPRLEPNRHQFLSEEQLTQAKPQTQLILSDGKSVAVTKEHSTISYDQSGSIVIDQTDTLTNNISKSPDQPSLNHLIVPYGMKSSLELSDGTLVYLNAGSQLMYPASFEANTREVFLTGEAFFDVAKDNKRPFIVNISNIDYSINVLGTRFNISAYASDQFIETVLEKGSVKLIRHGWLTSSATVLKPGQMARLNVKSKEEKVTLVNSDYYTMWTQGLLLFEGEDLSRIVSKLERFYNIHISFANPLLGGIAITGKLDLNSGMEKVFETLSYTASIKITSTDNTNFIIND